MTDEGGNVVGSTITQPMVRRSGLFMDSEMTAVPIRFVLTAQWGDVIDNALQAEDARGYEQGPTGKPGRKSSR